MYSGAEILGRDITLEDVLVALNKICRVEKDDDYIQLARPSYDGRDEIRINFKRDGAFIWQLNKPLHLQSKETIDSLHELICKG